MERSLTNLACRRVQPPNILRSDDVHETATLHVSYLDEAGLKSKDVWIEDGKRLWIAFPCDLPVVSCSPSIAVDEEGIVRVTKQELATHAFDMNWSDVFFANDKVERRIGLVEQRLRLQCLETDNFESARAANAELGAQEMYRRRFGRDVELLVWLELVLSLGKHLSKARLLGLVGHVLLRFEDLDSCGERRGLNRRHELLTHADTGFEEVSMADLSRTLSSGLSFVAVQRLGGVRIQSLVRQDQQDLVLLEYINLRDTLHIQDSPGPHRSVFWLALHDVDTGIRTESQLTTAICECVS